MEWFGNQTPKNIEKNYPVCQVRSWLIEKARLIVKSKRILVLIEGACLQIVPRMMSV